MKWSDSYATGIARIDEQHKMLFQMSEDYRLALDEGTGQRVYALFLRALKLYASSHFSYEEGCMDRCRCAAAKSNREAHAGFIEFVKRHDTRYEADGFARADALALTETLDRWLADHIGRIDIQLRGCDD